MDDKKQLDDEVSFSAKMIVGLASLKLRGPIEFEDEAQAIRDHLERLVDSHSLLFEQSDQIDSKFSANILKMKIAIDRAIGSAFALGSYIVIPDSFEQKMRNEVRGAHKKLDDSRAEKARKGKAKKTTERKLPLPQAIINAFGAANLVETSKVVESYRPEICRLAGVKIDTRGYGTRSIQRAIGAILKERRES